jgi:general stress protein YciG
MTKQQAGSKGGRATFQKHGREHFQQIGKRGAATTWTRYFLAPIGQTEYAMVERSTNKIICIKGR